MYDGLHGLCGLALHSRKGSAEFAISSVASSLLVCWHVIRGRSSSLTLSYVAYMEYSHIGRQCLPRSGGKIENPAAAILGGVAPTVLDLFLLTFTVLKAVRSSALSESHSSSPIVCVMRDFYLWLKLIFNPQDARTIEPRASVRGLVANLHLILICLTSQVFSHYCESVHQRG